MRASRGNGRIIEPTNMTNEQIEIVLQHVATKEELQGVRTGLQSVRADLEKALREQLKWIILLHVPTWLGIIGLLLRHS